MDLDDQQHLSVDCGASSTALDSQYVTDDSDISTKLARLESEQVHSASPNVKYQMSITALDLIHAKLAELTAKTTAMAAKLQEMKNEIYNDITSHMRVRHIAIHHFWLFDVKPSMKDMCFDILQKRKGHMHDKEQEFIRLESMVGNQLAMLRDRTDACAQSIASCDHAIEIYRKSTMEDAQLAKLTSHIDKVIAGTKPLEELTIVTENSQLAAEPLPLNVNNSSDDAAFRSFCKLPTEIRLLIWNLALPPSRIHHFSIYNNLNFAHLHVCQESRKVAKLHCQRLLSPSKDFPQGRTQIKYANIHTDIIIRDLAAHDTVTHALFALREDFMSSCHKNLVGLSEVRNLALGCDLIQQTGRVPLRSVQTCCPKLENITLFPSVQLTSRPVNDSHVKFVTVDSNLLNYIDLRRNNIKDRRHRRRVTPGIGVTNILVTRSRAYKMIIKSYIEAHGCEWKPCLEIALLAVYNTALKSWSLRRLKALGDRTTWSVVGDDGDHHKSFLSSFFVAGEDGELYSRYDGMERLFKEE